MTGGRVVVLGPTGRNFAAGMSGGDAYVLDLDEGRVNPELVELGAGRRRATPTSCATLVRRHAEETGSTVAAALLADWPAALARFTAGHAARLQAGARRARPRRSRRGSTRTRPTVHAIMEAAAMADPRGLPEDTAARSPTRRPVEERVSDWNEVYPDGVGRALLPIISTQAGRCMDCGIPFCHQGCPLGNLIPEWNDLVWRDDWDGAIERLHATNNFPEFTGRLCPAPCETACVLGINQDPVTIKNVEVAIIDRAWDVGLRPAAAARVAARARRSPSSAPARPGSPPPSS